MKSKSYSVATGSETVITSRPKGMTQEEYRTLRREAEIYRAVHATGVPSPAVLGVHPTLEAVLLERIEGDAAFARLDVNKDGVISIDDLPDRPFP